MLVIVKPLIEMTPFLIFVLVVCTPSLARLTSYNSNLDFENFNDDLDDDSSKENEWEEENSLELNDRSIDYGDYYTREALPFSKTCEIIPHNIIRYEPKSLYSHSYVKNVTCEPATHHHSHFSRPSSRRDFCIIKHQETDKNKQLCQTEYTKIIKNEPGIYKEYTVGVGCKGCVIGLKFIKSKLA